VRTGLRMSFEVIEIHIEEQKEFEGVGVFPLVLAPNAPTHTLNDVIHWIQQNKAHIEEKLLQHSVILFRGFAVDNAVAFDQITTAFGYEIRPYESGTAPRKHVVGNVYTANEAPAHIEILFHHEMAYILDWPKKVFFYGDVVAESRGETPILLSNEVYKRVLAKFPDLVEKLETTGIKYSRVTPAEDDEKSSLGRGWKSSYGATREEAEIKFKERDAEFEWLEGGDVRLTVANPIPPIQVDERTGKKVWFNNIVTAFYVHNDARNASGSTAFFADGTPLPRETVLEVINIMNEICVNHQWQHGDILLIDNRTALHGRRPFTGSRRVYATLTKN